jgi:hypothetical protein
MTTMTAPQISYDDGAYRPGACNIGPAEIARRQRAGILGFAAAAVLAASLLVIGAVPIARLVVALPLAAGSIGLLQARFHFCVAFALAGLRNFGPLGGVERVTEAGARSADLRTAALVTMLSAAIGAAGAVIFYMLPV